MSQSLSTSKVLEGKTAVVTGASEGIGKACVEAYAAAGARVVAISRNPEKLSQAFDQYRGQVFQLPLDLLTIEGGDSVVPKSVELLGHIDIFHGNVGSYLGGKLLDHSKEAIRNATRLNYGVQKDNIHDAVSHMVERGKGGQILLTSSWAAHVDTLWEENYASDKAALNKFARIVHRQYSDQGIRISTISPAATATALFEGWPEEKKKAQLEDGMTMPKDVADAAMTILTSSAYIPDIPLIPPTFSVERVITQEARASERRLLTQNPPEELQKALLAAKHGYEYTPKM
ncbi:MAG: SDR family NAD(P)-dependent oxidoreductase [Alphaproteobacteria bacterium]